MSSTTSPKPRGDGWKHGRAAFDATSHTPEERSEHSRKAGKAAAESRLILSGQERQALAAAYQLLGNIVARQPYKFDVGNQADV